MRFSFPIFTLCIFTVFLFSSECKAQYGGGFGGFSQRDRDRQHRQFIAGYKKKKENGDNLEGYFRTQSNINFAILHATYKLDYSYPGGYSSSQPTTYFTGELETPLTAKAYGFGGEHYFPLGKLSDKSLMALTLGVDFLYTEIKTGELRLNGGQKFSPTFQIIQFNLPVGLMFKSGTDAVFRKNVKSGFSFGGGALLSASTALTGQSKISPRPYCVAEVAFYTGFCWKIRGTGYLGNSTIIRGEQSVGIGGSEQESNMTLVGNTSFMLSLIITQFSWDWEED